MTTPAKKAKLVKKVKKGDDATPKTFKPVKKTKKVAKKTYVAIVLDRSGSMANIHKQTVDGLNEQFNVLRRDADIAGDMEVVLIQFDDHIDVLLNGTKPADLKNWELNDFQPRGWTAMYDAVWAAINTLKSKVETDDTGFLVCVISDGDENASKEVTQLTLSKEIKRLQDTGKWTFSYMLANQDIHEVSKRLNVDTSNMASFKSTGASASFAYTANASAMSNYLDARGAGQTMVRSFYSNTTLENTNK
jgi:Mg-chelatase subunit ChlD